MASRPALLLALAAGAVLLPGCSGSGDALERVWDVKLLARPYSLAKLGLDATARSFPMTNAKGETYKCYVKPSDAAPTVDDSAARDSRVMQAKFQLERHSRLCIIKSEGYWTYELCVGEHVRQFHKEEIADSNGLKGASYEYKLGLYSETSDAVVSREGGGLVLQQQYDAGTEGRIATVQYDCDAGLALKGTPAAVSYEIISVSEPSPKNYSLHVAVRDPAFCNHLPSPTRVLGPLNHTCIEHVEGWWTYEICLGGKVRQYHSDNGKAVQESVIGVYNASYGQKLDASAPGINAALVQHYSKGTPCDVRKGRPREAKLRFECNNAAAAAAASTSTGSKGSTSSASSVSSSARTITLTLVSIRESPTCEYTIIFSTPLACEHPDTVPVNQPVVAATPSPVYCLPQREEGDDGEDEDEDEGAGAGAAQQASAGSTGSSGGSDDSDADAVPASQVAHDGAADEGRDDEHEEADDEEEAGQVAGSAEAVLGPDGQATLAPEGGGV